MHFPTLACAALAFMLASVTAPLQAQEATSADSIVKALNAKPKTRSIGQTPGGGLSEDQVKFVDGLRRKTREIVVEERQQLAKIVKQQGLPSIDLEVNFALNSAAIGNQAQSALIQLGLALQNPKLQGAVILLNGHTDATGSAEHNQQLSERRARGVKTFLTDTFGVDPNRVISVGYGEEQLKNPDQPDAGENRRVQIVNLVR